MHAARELVNDTVNTGILVLCRQAARVVRLGVQAQRDTYPVPSHQTRVLFPPSTYAARDVSGARLRSKTEMRARQFPSLAGTPGSSLTTKPLSFSRSPTLWLLLLRRSVARVRGTARFSQCTGPSSPVGQLSAPGDGSRPMSGGAG